MINHPMKLGPLSLLLGYHLRHASLVFSPDVRRPKGVDRGMIGILSVVSANPGINQTSVGKALRIDPGNLVSLIDKLVDKGFLKRTVRSDDRRVRSLTLTRAGEAKLKGAVQASLRSEARMLPDFSARDRRTLVALLTKIYRR